MNRGRLIAIAVVALLVAAGFIPFARDYLWRPEWPNTLLLFGNIEAHESLLSFQVSGRIADSIAKGLIDLFSKSSRVRSMINTRGGRA